MVQHDASVNGPRVSKDGNSVPVASMVENIVGCKWAVRLLQLCVDGHRRPSAFLRACPGLSAKVLNERLQKMIRFGIIRRTVLGEKPPIEVEYLLTPFGRRFLGILDEVRRLQEAVDHGAIAESDESREEAARSGRLTLVVQPLLIRGDSMQSQYKPANYSTVSPYLIVNGADATIAFLKRVFGAIELRRFPDDSGKLMHAELRIDDTVIMLADSVPPDWPSISSHVHIYVPDVDAIYRKALQAGAVSVQEPVQKRDEDKRGGVKDAGGTTWWIATKVE